MAQGCSVRLGGIGSFYFTVATNNNGVATEKEVTAALINSVRVRFIPENRLRLYQNSSSNPIITLLGSKAKPEAIVAYLLFLTSEIILAVACKAYAHTEA